MERTFAQLSLEDRREISGRHQAGQSSRQIAAALDRAPSTIARELKRNAGRKVGYKPAYAHEQTRAWRWTGTKLARKPDLQATVLDQLARGYSPERIGHVWHQAHVGPGPIALRAKAGMTFGEHIQYAGNGGHANTKLFMRRRHHILHRP